MALFVVTLKFTADIINKFGFCTFSDSCCLVKREIEEKDIAWHGVGQTVIEY